MFHDALNQIIGINVVVSVHIDALQGRICFTLLTAVDMQAAVLPVKSCRSQLRKVSWQTRKWVGGRFGFHERGGATIKTPKHLEDFRTTALFISKINTNHHDFSICLNNI